MILGLALSPAMGPNRSTSAPTGALPADAYQQPIAEGNEGYWRWQDDGYFQEPLP